MGRTLASLSLLFCWFAAGPARGQEKTTTRYFEQLRRRGLFRLAEGVCLRELARDDAKPSQRSQWTLELSRTLAEHAKYTAGREQAELWQRATGVIDDFLKAEPAAPRREWLQVQRATVLVWLGEYRRWEAGIFPYNDALRKQAGVSLDGAIASLQQLESRFHAGGAPGPNGKDPRAASHGVDRAGLLRYVRYQRAVACINRAELAPAPTAARKDFARRAQELLVPLSKSSSANEITWNSRLLLAVVDRLNGDYEQATDRLAAIEKSKPPADIIDGTVAERARLLLAVKHPEQADRMLQSYRKVRGGLPGELAFLKVKTSFALWEQDTQQGKNARAAERLKQAAADVQSAEKTIGGYWGYRCRVLFDFLKDARLHGPELTAAMRRAEASFHNGDLAKAAGDYAAAARIAERSPKAATRRLAAELLYTQASIQLQRGETQSAATTFRKVADSYPQDKRAASAHLMWAYCLGRLYEARRTKSRRLAYTRALEEHRKRYSDSPTRHEAAWMLAALHDYRRQTTESLKLYLSIPASHPRGPVAQAEAARCYEEIIERLRELHKPAERAAWEAHAVEQLGRIIAAFPGRPGTWDRRQAVIALRTARIELNRTPPRYDAAAELLDRTVASAEAALRNAKLPKDDRTAWTGLVRSARQLQIVALAGTGRYAQAQTMVSDLARAGAAEVLAVLDGLMQLGTQDEALRTRLGSLQLQTARELNKRRSSLKENERRWLDRCLAQAYSAAGSSAQAAELYERLLAKSPGDAGLLKTAADLLEKTADRESLKKARGYWRKLEGIEKRGSADWLTARYHVAACAYQLGEYAECKKLLDVTRLIYPQLGGDALRKKYASLQKDVEAKLAR